MLTAKEMRAAKKAMTREEWLRIGEAMMKAAEYTGALERKAALADELAEKIASLPDEYGAGLPTCPGCHAHKWQHEGHREGCWWESVEEIALKIKEVR